jgi:formiminotetrahydrofolate cyclodeaminase
MTNDFLEAIASTKPIPGGGGASAFAACIGMALLEKIIRIELGRKELDAPRSALWSDLLRKTLQSKETLSRLKVADGESYIRWAEAKASGANATALSDLLGEAVEIPLAIMEEAIRTTGIVSKAVERCKPHLLPDALAAAELLAAAARGAAHIASANLERMRDPSHRSILGEKLDGLRNDNDAAFTKVCTAVSDRPRSGDGASARHSRSSSV